MNIKKSIQIQELEPVKQHFNSNGNFIVSSNGTIDTKTRWKRYNCKCRYNNCNCEILYFEQNMTSNIESHKNSFLGAFMEAYNNHGEILLSPDNIAIIVNIHLSKYINKNSEKMRSIFVSHAGKKELRVTSHGELKESQWGEFFTEIKKEIKQNLNDDIYDSLNVNFSSSTDLENTIKTCVVMDSMKSYFNYTRCIPCCGIKAVHFAGSNDDWEKLKLYILNLKQYDIDGSWNKYIDNIIPIVTEFINTYNNNVNVEFWNKIMDSVRGRLGSGSCTKISGWILNFFGIYKEVVADDIPSYKSETPVVLINKLTGIDKNVKLHCGFSGINKTGDIYSPQLSLCIIANAVS